MFFQVHNGSFVDQAGKYTKRDSYSLPLFMYFSEKLTP